MACPVLYGVPLVWYGVVWWCGVVLRESVFHHTSELSFSVLLVCEVTSSLFICAGGVLTSKFYSVPFFMSLLVHVCADVVYNCVMLRYCKCCEYIYAIACCEIMCR